MIPLYIPLPRTQSAVRPHPHLFSFPVFPAGGMDGPENCTLCLVLEAHCLSITGTFQVSRPVLAASGIYFGKSWVHAFCGLEKEDISCLSP